MFLFMNNSPLKSHLTLYLLFAIVSGFSNRLVHQPFKAMPVWEIEQQLRIKFRLEDDAILRIVNTFGTHIGDIEKCLDLLRLMSLEG